MFSVFSPQTRGDLEFNPHNCSTAAAKHYRLCASLSHIILTPILFTYSSFSRTLHHLFVLHQPLISSLCCLPIRVYQCSEYKPYSFHSMDHSTIYTCFTTTFQLHSQYIFPPLVYFLLSSIPLLSISNTKLVMVICYYFPNNLASLILLLSTEHFFFNC